MGRNFFSVCHECRVSLMHYRGKESDHMQEFANTHGDHEKRTAIYNDYVVEPPDDYTQVTDLLVKDSTPPQSVSNVPTEDKRVVEARIDELGKVERWYSENTGTTSYSALTQDIKDRIKELEGNK